MNIKPKLNIKSNYIGGANIQSNKNIKLSVAASVAAIVSSSVKNVLKEELHDDNAILSLISKLLGKNISSYQEILNGVKIENEDEIKKIILLRLIPFDASVKNMNITDPTLYEDIIKICNALLKELQKLQDLKQLKIKLEKAKQEVKDAEIGVSNLVNNQKRIADALKAEEERARQEAIKEAKELAKLEIEAKKIARQTNSNEETEKRARAAKVIQTRERARQAEERARQAAEKARQAEERATKIQSISRMNIARKQLKNAKKKVLQIQTFYRMTIAQKKLIELRKLALTLQRIFRDKKARTKLSELSRLTEELKIYEGFLSMTSLTNETDITIDQLNEKIRYLREELDRLQKGLKIGNSLPIVAGELTNNEAIKQGTNAIQGMNTAFTAYENGKKKRAYEKPAANEAEERARQEAEYILKEALQKKKETEQAKSEAELLEKDLTIKINFTVSTNDNAFNSTKQKELLRIGEIIKNIKKQLEIANIAKDFVDKLNRKLTNNLNSKIENILLEINKNISSINFIIKNGEKLLYPQNNERNFTVERGENFALAGLNPISPSASPASSPRTPVSVKSDNSLPKTSKTKLAIKKALFNRKVAVLTSKLTKKNSSKQYKSELKVLIDEINTIKKLIETHNYVIPKDQLDVIELAEKEYLKIYTTWQVSKSRGGHINKTKKLFNPHINKLNI